MNYVQRFQGKALLKTNNQSILCQLTVINSSLMIKSIQKMVTQTSTLNICVSFTEMEYSIRWVMQNQMISEMIVANSVRRYQFFPIENSLSLLKPFLDGQIPYRDFDSQYLVVKLIKKMQGGQVVQVINKLTNQIEVAKQIFFGSKYDLAHNKLIQNEIAVATHFAEQPHNNLLKLLVLYVDKDSVISLYKLANLFQGGLPLNFLKKIMKTILKAIRHMHMYKIMHRDIKMDNILMRNINDPKSIVIIDYGLAQLVGQEKNLIQKCGTPGYIAPEVLEGEEYNELCDIYSVAQVFRILLDWNSNYPLDEFSTLSDLLQKMEKNQKFRLTAQGCLDHDFFVKCQLENKMKKLQKIVFKNPFVT